MILFQNFRFLSRRSLSPALVVFALIAVWTVPLHAVAWVSRHGLTGQQYQDEFNKWTGKGLRLHCVSGYSVGGQTLFAALWDNTPSAGWSAAHGMSAASFNTNNANSIAAGLQPAYINMYESGGSLTYAAIWEVSGLDTVTRLGRTYAQFQSDLSQQSTAGYDLATFSACSISGTDYYSAIWRERRGIFTLAQTTSLRMNAAAFQTEFNLRTSQGYRMHMVTGYQVGSEDRYSAHWFKPFGDPWWSYTGLSSNNLQSETSNAAYQGCRPEFVSAYTSGGQARFNAVWTANGGMSFDALNIINTGMNQYMQQYNTAGVSLAISRNGRLVYAKGFGYADQAAGDWVGPQHRFRVASVSKIVTSAAIMKLSELRGNFDLGDTVFGTGAVLGTQYGNGSYSTREKQITVRHLLSHTTGWTSDGPMWDNSYGANHTSIMNWTLDNNEPASTPGSFYQYMNLDFHVLGRIIEKYSGQTYEAYCKSAILAPCGVTAMEIGNQTKAGRKPNEVVYYDPAGTDPYTDIDPHRMDANGGWIATPVDLLLMLRRIDNVDAPPDILNTASRMAMRTAGPASNSGNYGDGWFWAGNNSWEGHNGCMTGTSSYLIHQANGTSYAVVANKRTNCSAELKAAVDAIVSQLDSQNAWPSYNLFPPNSGYAAWKDVYFPDVTAADIPGLNEWLDFSADPDYDGLPNMLEAYFGSHPLQPGSPPGITCTFDGSDAIFSWSRTAFDFGVTAQPLSSPDCKTWTGGQFSTTDVSSGLFGRSMQSRISSTGKKRLFMHLEASER